MIYILIKKIYSIFWKRYQIINWKRSGKRYAPPHFFKSNLIKHYARKNSLHILIETGTGDGNMIYACLKHFKKIFSIELSTDLYKNAIKRFEKYNYVQIHNGNSSTILPKILKNIENPVLFWLDAHYSGGNTARGKSNTPILKELEQIFKNFNDKSIVLIDDANLFNGENGYPTFSELKQYVSSFGSNWQINNRDNIIRIKLSSIKMK